MEFDLFDSSDNKRTYLKVLSKSRFKLGLECPNKLYFTGNKHYANQKQADEFLEALAQGGFQVEELARLHYPTGMLISDKEYNYNVLHKETENLLKQENVVLFEAAFLHNDLFVRTDILVKKGNNIQLIEVKAKSFSPLEKHLFIGAKGKIKSTWKPYLFDIAFQKHVIQQCNPNFNISSHLMMADKSKKASINGLNQLFRISKKGEERTGILKKVNSLQQIGNSILGKKDVSHIVESIEQNKFKYYDNLNFLEAITMFKDAYKQQTYLNWPTNFIACKKCEFKCNSQDETEGLKSGFKHCFTTQHNWGAPEFNKPQIFDIANFRKGSKLFEQGIYFKEELTEDNIEVKASAGKLSQTERQWLQIEKELKGDNSIFVDKQGLKEAMDAWQYPLHFIDFETSAAALPFNKNRGPYEQIAFQFSHHIYYKNGHIEHKTEYINNKAGVFPNFEFTRALMAALSKDNGTIFKYATHENSILNAIYLQLKSSNEPDKKVLMDFIKSITHSKKDSVEFWCGERDMVDLCQVIKDYYYNPLTKGSNSIKAVLPAILNTSKFIQNKYAKPLNKLNVTSKNFHKTHIWLKQDQNNSEYINPYKILPKLFENWTDEDLELNLSEMNDIANGGSALTAYSKLQYTDMSQAEINELTKGLLKYCELDTLAMVFIYEHFKEDLV